MAYFETDNDVRDALRALLQDNDGEVLETVVTLAYGAYQIEKLQWVESCREKNGKAPTPKQEENWIGAITEGRLKRVVEWSIATFESSVQTVLEVERPKIESATEKGRMETTLEGIDAKMATVEIQSKGMSGEQLGWSFAMSFLASLAIILISAIFYFGVVANGNPLPEGVSSEEAASQPAAGATTGD